MTIPQILSLFGFSSIFLSIVGWIVVQLKQVVSEIKALKAGTQAVLRNELLKSYSFCKRQGFADFDDRLNFENLYTQYHSLGANGVMDNIRDKFFELPTEKEV